MVAPPSAQCHYSSMALSVTELSWLSKAVSLAHQASHTQWRVGALVVKSGRVLGSGTNRYRNHPSRVDRDGVSYHAEEVALRRSGRVSGSTIYVARVTRSGTIGLALPCPRCQQDLLESGVTTAIWTEPMGWGKAKISDLLGGKNGYRTRCNSQKHPLLN